MFSKRWKITWRHGVTLVALLALSVPLFLFSAFHIISYHLGPLSLEKAKVTSTIVVDRNDNLLRAFTTKADRWRLPVALDDVDPKLVKMLLAYEDKRFFSHPGIDPFAVGRAAWQFLSNGRVISGGSTITMQVARLLEPRAKRSVSAKLRQWVRAIQIESQFTKREILGLYFKLAPYGGNIEGVRAAALTYFGREPKRLTTSQAALLVALPQSPEYRRPDRRHKSARNARNRVLARLQGYGVLSPDDVAAARTEPVPDKRLPFPKLAPHLAEAEVARHRDKKIHRLTIDRGVQTRLEVLAKAHIRRFSQKHSMAMIAADHRTGEILAYLGAANYLDKKSHGPIDMTRSLRSPGSALKPFVYGLAFEAGLAHPETLIEDRPVRFGRYQPKNFDDSFHGTVTIRRALQMSLNIPAIKLLHGVGPARLVRRFEQAGAKIVLPRDSAPTLPVVLGGLGISLLDLTGLYTGLAGDGVPQKLVWHRSEKITANDIGAALRTMFQRKSKLTRAHNRGGMSDPNAMFSPAVAWYVRDIMRGTPPPLNAVHGKIAYKTGTSYGYRDAWSIGFDGAHVIGVWVGQPDGTASPAMTGYTAAAPILFDAFQKLGHKYSPMPAKPQAALVATNSKLPPPLRRYLLPGETTNTDIIGPKLKIVYPIEGARVALTERIASAISFEPLALKASGGVLPLTWMVNGRPIPSARRRQATFWTPDGEGFTKISVIDANGQSASIKIRID